MSASSSSHGTGSKDLDGAFYEAAATKGDFQAFENYAQPLDRLILGENQNTILHVHLNTPNERSKEFVEKVLGKCPQLLWQTNNDGDIPLHIAAKYKHLEIVKVFIEEAKKPIHRDLETGEEEADSIRRMLRLTNKQKETALHLAVRGECLDVVEEILKQEDPKFTYTANISGESPLYLAVANISRESYLAVDENIIYHHEIAEEIINKFESPDCGGPNGSTVFHAAILGNTWWEFNYKRLLDLMFSRVGSFVNQADESGWTPLHYAAYRCHFYFVRKILGKDKSSAYATDKDRNRTPLHMASCRGSASIMKEIIDKCPECCEIRDGRGWNPLHYAVISKSEEAVKAIMKDPSLVYLIGERDVKGYTPFHLLVVSRPSSPLISWISEKSAVAPSKFWQHNLCSIFTGIYKYMLNNKDGSYKEEILKWMEDLGKDPFGETIEVAAEDTKIWYRWQKEREERVIPELEKAKDSHLVAAALVATVTFAAAFTLPGGYISNDNDSNLKMGSPILNRNASFKAFVVTDAIAMVLSTSSVFIHFIMVLLGYKQRYYWLIRSAFWFVVLAMGAMVVAFVTGTYAVLAPNSKRLAIATFVIGLTFFLHVSYTIIRLIFGFIKRDEDFYYWPFTSITASLRRPFESVPLYLSCGLKGHKEDE